MRSPVPFNQKTQQVLWQLLACLLIHGGSIVDAFPQRLPPDDQSKANVSRDLAAVPVTEMQIAKKWDKPRPSSVRLVPGVLREVRHYGGELNHPALGPGEAAYEPLTPGGFGINNGTRYFNRPLFFRGNTVGAGDRPMFAITRSYIKNWAGKLRFGLINRDKGKWLDEFRSVRAELYVGHASYECRDDELGINVELLIAPTLEGWGTVVRLRVSGPAASESRLVWIFGDINTAEADPGGYWVPSTVFSDAPGNEVEEIGGVGTRITIDTARAPRWQKVLSGMDLEAAEFIVGTNWPSQQLGRMSASSANSPPRQGSVGQTGNIAAAETPMAASGKTWEGYLTLVWGGQENPKSVARYQAGMSRLNLDWGMDLYERWHENYLKRGSNPRQTFDAIRTDPAVALNRALQYWETMHSRIKIDTPDPEFNSFANWLAASQEYLHWPIGQMSGIHTWGLAYLHISNMYSGWDYLGAHDQQQEWMKLFATGVRNGWIGLYHGIAPWMPGENAAGGEEDQIAHYLNCVYENWLWTADKEFVRQVWPDLKSIIAREIRQSDPDGDGLFAARFPYWGPENSSWGPASEIQSAQMLRALSGASEMAEAIGDSSAATYYKGYADKTSTQLKSRLWNQELGMLGYRDPMDVQMLQPEAAAIFLPILRNTVDGVQAYQMLRYIKDDLWSEVVPGVARIWTCNHFGRMHKNGPTPDIPLTAAAAGLVGGDVDKFWPVIKTVAHSYFYSSWPGAQGDSIFPWGAGGASMNDHNDGRMPALYLLGRAMFGLEPDVPHNRLSIHPRIPSEWNRVNITTPDVAYKFERSPSKIRMEITTPRALAKTVYIPVRQAVASVFIDGRPSSIALEPQVNNCELKVDVREGIRNVIEVKLAGKPVHVRAPRTVTRNEPFVVQVDGADGVELVDPQSCISSMERGKTEVRLTANEPGTRTAFLKVRSGEMSFFSPLDLDVRESVELLDGKVANDSRSLELVVRNNGGSAMKGTGTLRTSGREQSFIYDLPTSGDAPLVIPLSDQLQQVLTPGLNNLSLSFGPKTYNYNLVDWEIMRNGTALSFSIFERSVMLDLAWFYHEQASSLFNTKWYYDVWQMGIDYPVLPPATYEWSNHRISDPAVNSPRFLSTPGVPFYLATEKKLGGVYQGAEGGGPRNILPIANWRPYLYPTNIKINTEGKRLSKIYFLAYSWERGQKTYHPNVELVAHYRDGTQEVRQLIPPYSFTPQYGLRSVGRNPYRAEVVGSGLTLGKSAAADVYDLPLNPDQEVDSVEVRSVTSESLFAIFAITLVKAPEFGSAALSSVQH